MPRNFRYLHFSLVLALLLPLVAGAYEEKCNDGQTDIYHEQALAISTANQANADGANGSTPHCVFHHGCCQQPIFLGSNSALGQTRSEDRELFLFSSLELSSLSPPTPLQPPEA